MPAHLLFSAPALERAAWLAGLALTGILLGDSPPAWPVLALLVLAGCWRLWPRLPPPPPAVPPSQADRYLAAEAATARALETGTRLDEVVPPLLEGVASGLGWDVAGYWARDPAATASAAPAAEHRLAPASEQRPVVLRCSALWLRDEAAFAPFREVVARLLFKEGEGLVGRVAATRQPAWIADVASESDFPRRAIALRVGLVAGFAVPILLGDELVGVLDFFTRQRQPCDAELVPLLPRLTGQVSAFLQRQRAADELRKTLAEVKDLYNRAPCAYHSLDADGRFLRINDTALTWLGYRRDEVIGRPFADFLTPASRELFRAIFPAFKARGWVRDQEVEFVRKDGTTLQALLGATVVRDPEGHFLHSRSTWIDITDRKKTERRLAEVNTQLEAVLAAATEVAVIATDTTGTITVFNTGAERLLGWTAKELIGQHTPVQFHRASELKARVEELKAEFGDRLADFDLLVAKARRDGHDRQTWTYVCKDGSERRVNLVLTLLRGPRGAASGASLRPENEVGGEVAGYLGMAIDVTESERARERLEMTMAAAHIGLWDWDVVNNRATRSDNVTTIFGVPPGRIESTCLGFLEFVLPEDAPRVTRTIQEALASTEEGASYACDFRIRRPDGAVRCIEDRGRVFRGPGGKVVRLMGTVLDVTERVQGAGVRSPSRAATSSGKSEDRGEGVPASSTAEKRSLRVLMVEDNPVNQQVQSLLLEKMGHTVELASNGLESLEKADKGSFDLILMDLHMPTMDGLRATRLIRAREKATGRRVPIVAVTATSLPEDRQRSAEVGMDGYLTKPLRGNELEEVLARVLPAPSGGVDAAFDWHQAVDSLGFEGEMVRGLVQTFMDTTPGRLSDLEQHLDRGDLAQARHAAHALKGALMVFGVPALVGSARAVEERAIEGRQEVAREACRRLKDGLLAFLDELGRFLQP